MSERGLSAVEWSAGWCCSDRLQTPAAAVWTEDRREDTDWLHPALVQSAAVSCIRLPDQDHGPARERSPRSGVGMAHGQ